MKWIAAFAFGLGAPARASRLGLIASLLLWPWLPGLNAIATALM